MRSLMWMYFTRSFLIFFNILPFPELNCIASWFKQQQDVIACFKVADTSVLAVFIGKQSSKLQEQLLNSSVISQKAVPCLICVYMCGVGLLKLWVLCFLLCGCYGISPCCVCPLHSSYATTVLYLQSGSAQLKME